ncbi:MAG TPA: helix-turn-helix domain-containing protein [Methylomusa anaerophila]|uniref:Helix-turn-helix domain protein n=1 Tax=Methylomusa anaerophila TaxID=1930071 RepID=A0A348AIV6_9FIRM|nr:helix-turn-helix domain-containing protein [Methylomusa anaerophila]BBB91004.1 helix-turn-helix domain protein [Methylomusa anaerophila]HML88875.1 helix-turn-helix domain-containing protein [Methylomusa anaerophila]
MTFGEIVKISRENKRLSQEDVSKAIEKKYGVRLSTSYLSMIETGMRTNLTVNLLNALLDFFNLPYTAAASLFSRLESIPEYSPGREPATVVLESKAPFPSNTDNQIAIDDLPSDAKRSLNDFYEFLLYKYKTR